MRFILPLLAGHVMCTHPDIFWIHSPQPFFGQRLDILETVPLLPLLFTRESRFLYSAQVSPT